MSWSEIDERLGAAMHYWIGTVGADGVAVVRPIDGMWHDGALYFGGDPASRWFRNLQINPRVSLNLEDADRAVIADGEVETIRADTDLAVQLCDASNAKYQMGQTVSDYDGAELNRFRPNVVLAWNLLYKDATRFTWD